MALELVLWFDRHDGHPSEHDHPDCDSKLVALAQSYLRQIDFGRVRWL